MPQESCSDMSICVVVYCIVRVLGGYGKEVLDFLEKITNQAGLVFIRNYGSGGVRNADQAQPLFHGTAVEESKHFSRYVDQLSALRGTESEKLRCCDQIPAPFAP